MFNSVPDTQEEFWKKVESTLQCSVLAYGLAQYNREFEKNKAIWGLMYVSECGVHFYHFPQQSWISAIMKTPPSEEVSINLLFQDIESWRPPQKVNFLQALIGRSDTRLLIRGKHTNISTTQNDCNNHNPPKGLKLYSFSLDMRKENIIKNIDLYISKKRFENIL